VKGRPICKIYGTYIGFLEFDGQRYWDIRDTEKFPMVKPNFVLPSDSRHRPDLCKLIEGKIEEAQLEKEKLENIQRADKKLRVSYNKI